MRRSATVEPATGSTTAPEEPAAIPAPDPSPTAAASALLAGFGLLMIGNGLQGSLIGVRAEIENFTTIATGLTMTAYFVGFLFGTTFASSRLATVGHIRVFAALASVASAAALIHAVAVVPGVWILMRFVTGVTAAGLYVVAESWLNDIASNATRGRLLAAYMVVSMGGLGVGQLLLGAADPAGFTLFAVASVLFSVSLVPISLSTTSAPPVEVPERMRIRDLAREVPTGVVGALVVGIAHGGLIGMGAVYATRQGLRPSEVAVFMGAAIFGAVVFQFPVGVISDRVPRRGLIVAISLGATASALLLIGRDPSTSLATALMFVLGGMTFPLYSLVIAYTNDWIPRSQMLGASASLVALTGMGAIAGPLIVAATFLVADTSWFFAVIAVTHAVLATYLLWRIAARPPIPVERQRRWVPLASRGTAAIAVLARGRRTRPPADAGRSEAAVPHSDGEHDRAG